MGLGQSRTKTRRRGHVDLEPSLALLGNFGRQAQHEENWAWPRPLQCHWPFSEWPRPEVPKLETPRLRGVPPWRRFLTSRPATATAASPYGRPGTYGPGGWLVGLCSGRGPRQVGPAQGGLARVRRSAGAGRGRKRPRGPPWALTEGDRGRLPRGRSGRVGATWAPLTCPQPPRVPARVLSLCQACQLALIPCLFPKLWFLPAAPLHGPALSSSEYSSSPHLAPLLPHHPSLANPNTGFSSGPRPRRVFPSVPVPACTR